MEEIPFRSSMARPLHDLCRTHREVQRHSVAFFVRRFFSVAGKLDYTLDNGGRRALILARGGISLANLSLV